jgi:hypothetical protein
MKKNIYREELEKAIANLYDTFAIYPLRSQIEACPCCVKEEDKKLIYTNSLNLLTGSQEAFDILDCAVSSKIKSSNL